MDAKADMFEHPDRLIDAALVEFVQAEPLAGIEERVLARLRSSVGDPAGSPAFAELLTRQPAMAITALACVTLLALLWWAAPGSRLQPSGGQISPRAVATPGLAGAGGPASQTAMRSTATVPVALTHSRATQRELPKLAVFPTPSPLSPQERTLMALARQQPELFQQAAESHYTSLHGEDSPGAQVAAVVPMEIEKIKIEPLSGVEEEQ